MLSRVIFFLILIFYCVPETYGSNFRVGVREYNCPSNFDRCYIAFCKYDDWLYSGYYRMGCADKGFCKHRNVTWRSRCSELKGVDTFYNRNFLGIGCRVCGKDLCNGAP
uniref:BPTI/Kunitz inhibitor domain-containing protein n=1 Tax=Meloidogyne hapla TaxID=6305 RepID=A0A1I8C1M6_MELHA